MENNDFIRGLPNNIKSEIENSELVVDANELAISEFPGDTPKDKRGRELAKKAFIDELTSLELKEYDKLLAEKKRESEEKRKPKDSGEEDK